MATSQKQIAGWQIVFDKAATEAAYSALPLDMGCDCSSCQNYRACVPNFPNDVYAFFEELGIELAKPSEVYTLQNGLEADTVFYGGFYHLVGSYLSGNDVWQPIAKNIKTQNATALYKIADGFEIGFTKNLDLVPDNFPLPALQMEINFTLPWVLKEAQPY